MTSWADIATADPDLAARVRRRFESNLHHVLGTVRPDGSPRLSGSEVSFDDEVRIGMMPGSRKLADVLRDPRIEIHSAPLEDDLANGDARLTGRLRHVGDTDGQPGSAFVLDIDSVVLVRVEADELVLETWRAHRGRETTRRR